MAHCPLILLVVATLLQTRQIRAESPTVGNHETDTNPGQNPTPDGQLYDVFGWFPKDSAASECAALLLDRAQSPALNLGVSHLPVHGGGGSFAKLTCDYRTGTHLFGARVEIEAFSTSAFVSQARGANWWENHCGSDAYPYSRGQLICNADGSFIELRRCNDVWCDTFYHFTDNNAWVTIMLTSRPGEEEDRIATVLEIGDQVRQVLAAKRAGDISPSADQSASDAPDEEGAAEAASQELRANVGLYPDPPVPGKVVVFQSQVSGQAQGEALSYAWYLDGEPLGTGETAQWTATLGEHAVSVEVRSAAAEDRIAIASAGFLVALSPATEDVDPGADAGWRMGALACTDDVTSDDRLACTASWTRDWESDLGALSVQWYLDGVLATWENSVGQSASFSLDQPAPGSHTIQVQLVDPASDAQASRSVTVNVAPGMNATIPVTARATAALGSSATLAGWLWLEWRRARQATVRPGTRRRCDGTRPKGNGVKSARRQQPFEMPKPTMHGPRRAPTSWRVRGPA